MQKNADAFRTISEVAEELALPQHVLRFWETRFPQIRPLKRAGGRRYYRPSDILLLKSIRALLYDEGYTIKGVQRLLKEQGPKGLSASAPADLGHEDSAEGEDVQGRGDSDADVHDGAADEDARQDDHDGEVASPPRSVEPIVPPPRQMFPQAAPSRPAAMDQYGPTFGPAWRAPPAGVLGSLQRDALETALLVLEDCERILAPLVRRPA